MKIDIKPDNVRSFEKEDRSERDFLCLISEDIFDQFSLCESLCYRRSEMRIFEASLASQQIEKERTDMLVIVSNGSHPVIHREVPFWKNMNKLSRLIEIPLFSTGVSAEFLNAYVGSLYITDPHDFNQRVDQFFAKLGQSRQIRCLNRTFETELVYRCASAPGIERWLEVGGYAELGAKQSYPCGEIEVSPSSIDRSVSFGAQQTLQIDGELIISGPNIVNAGYLPFVRTSQSRIYTELSHIDATAPLKLSISNGVVRSVNTIRGVETRGAQMLECIFNMDDRYSIVHEFGISLNRALSHLNGNHSYNEMVDDSEGQEGTLHLGLGLLPITQYHFDLFSRGTNLCFD
jgi:hypothetical protein